jgi:nitroreductase
MDLDLAMRTTGAVRAFADDPVSDETLFRVLDRARFAPSGGNRQPWRVIVVRDPQTRRRLRDLSQLGWREYIAFVEQGVVPFGPREDGRPATPAIDLEAARAAERPAAFVDDLDRVPVLLVIAAHLPSLAVLDWGLDRQSIVGGGSVYPFVQNLLLSARAEGLGGVMTTFLCRQEPAAKEALDLPDDLAIASVVALGVVDRFPSRLKRRPVEEFASVDRFGGPAFTGGT